MIVELATENAQKPYLGSSCAAGYDLFSSCNCEIPKRGQFLVNTGIKIRLPSNTYAQLKSRSGLATKHNIHVGAGVIDEDYRGEIKVLLLNHSEQDFQVNIGDRIAQMIILPVMRPSISLGNVENDTDRGENGFGSTGLQGQSNM